MKFEKPIEKQTKRTRDGNPSRDTMPESYSGAERAELGFSTTSNKEGVDKMPEKCTLCGGEFTRNERGQRVIYPYPMNHYLCYPCFKKCISTGIARLNYVLAGGNLDELKREDAKDDV